jgi:NAD(P)-dependent dehydrogenase (short-subunit alcohol dehydrogenase family)
LVTGGASGIGRATVNELCREGAAVAFTDVSTTTGWAANEGWTKAGFDVLFCEGDMADEAFCRRTVENALQRWGRVDYLVNNAFSFLAKGMDATREDWQRMLEVGPMAYALMTQRVVPAMKRQGGGSIVNVSSISAFIAQPNRWTYNAAKGAVNTLTKCMALDLAPLGIRVNSISPGWIWTAEVDRAAAGDRSRWEPIWGQFHQFAVLLKPPAGAEIKGATLVFKFTIPGTVIEQLKPLTLSASVSGTALPPETYSASGDQTYSREVPGTALKGDSVTVEFALDKHLPPQGMDQRELGVVASMIGFEAKP